MIGPDSLLTNMLGPNSLQVAEASRGLNARRVNHPDSMGHAGLVANEAMHVDRL